MANLFGLDIAKIVNDSITSAGNVRPGVLTHNGPPNVRDPENPSAGIQPTLTTHNIRGFVEQKEVRRSGQVGALFVSTVSILGESVNPKIIPEVNDIVVIDDVTYSLVELTARDPALALYEFRAQT